MKQIDDTALHILQELKQAEGFADNIRLDSIKGGAVNKAYRLLFDNRMFFVKVFTSEPIAQLDRQSQFTQQKQLAKLDLAPVPVYLAEDNLFQVDAWVQAPSLLNVALSSEVKYQQLADTLANIHQLKRDQGVKFPVLELPNRWRHYIELSQIQLGRKQQVQMQAMSEYWWAEIERESTVCHNDLSMEHVTAQPSKVVFDWEYSAYSSPYYDLASCLDVNQGSESEERTLLTYYTENTGLDYSQVKAKVGSMMPLVKLTNSLWFAAANKAC